MRLSPLQSKILLTVQEKPRLAKAEICRSVNGRWKCYCYDKDCYANPRKRRKLILKKGGCQYPKPTVFYNIQRLAELDLIRVEKEKKADGRNNRGWDWMKVSYSTCQVVFA